jgi:large subunit ribosomal protein L21
MLAIIRIKGNQYLVRPEKEYEIDSIGTKDDKKKIEFSEVLLLSDDSKVVVGNPIIAGAIVEAEILGEVKTPKTTVLKFHAKKRYQRTASQRSQKTRIKILKIYVKDKK